MPCPLWLPRAGGPSDVELGTQQGKWRRKFESHTFSAELLPVVSTSSDAGTVSEFKGVSGLISCGFREKNQRTS